MHARFGRKSPAGPTAAASDADTTALPAAPPPWRLGKLRLTLAGVGAFLVAITLLLLFYIGPQVIAAPVSFNQTYVLTATNASYFNAGTLSTELGANLTYTLTVRSDPSASSHTNAVWDSSAVLTDPLNKTTVNAVVLRGAFNRRTGEMLNCCGASLNGDTRVRQSGIWLLFPVNTNKATYQVFDPNSGHTFPATYTGTARVDGLTTYRFVQHVPPTVAAQMAGIPSYLLGLKGSSSSTVVANRYWSADNTFFVDPRTGVPIDEEVKGLSVLRGPGGQGKLTVADMDLKMTQSTQNQLVALANKNATSITLLRVAGPVGTGVLGVLLIAAAFIPFRRRPRTASSGQESLGADESARSHERVETHEGGLQMVTGSMRAADTGQDTGPANGAVPHGSKDTGRDAANGAVIHESADAARNAGPANGTKPAESEDVSQNAGQNAGQDAGQPATATARENDEHQD